MPRCTTNCVGSYGPRERKAGGWRDGERENCEPETVKYERRVVIRYYITQGSQGAVIKFLK